MPTFRGRKSCSCLNEWLPVFERELLRRGVIKHSIDIAQLVGGAAASGGTHATGGAFDIWQHDATTIKVAREMGAATWVRTRAQGFAPHAHGVLNGCPHNRPARYQIAALRAGRNGLGWMGLKGKDDGPGPRKLRTYKQGIAWAKAQVPDKPKPVPMRTTTITVMEQNCASDKPGWTLRAPLLNKRIRTLAPHIVSAVELYAARRPLLSTLLKSRYGMTTNHKGKVQYLRNNKNGWRKVATGKKYDLGNGKHAVAVHYQHRATGAELVVATPHLTNEHHRASWRKAEATRLVKFLARDFKGLPTLVAGDFNDSHRPTSTRPDDASGDVMKANGFHDLYYDIKTNEHKVNREYNTANGFKNPPTKDAIHLDRFFGTRELEGKSWHADVVTGRYPADHWGVLMDIEITHPK